MKTLSTPDAALPATPVVQPSIYRYVILLFAWGALLLSFVDRLAWGNLAVSVGASLGMQVGALGIFVTAFYIGYVLANVGGGFATDLLGPRRTIALALLPLGILTFAFGHTTTVTGGLVVQALMGLAAGCDYSACIKLTTAWFDLKRRGRAMGLLMTATSLAVVLTNAIIPKLLSVLGWGQVYERLGIVTGLFAVCCWLVLRDGPSQAVDVGGAKPQFRLLFKNRDLLFLTLSGFGAMWGTWGFTFWANALMVKGHGMTPIQAGAITMLFGIGAIISKPLIGLWSDWLGGRRKALVGGCYVGFIILLLVFGSLHSVAQFRLIAPLLGVAAFAYSPLTAAMVAEAAGRELAGSATGATNACWQLGSVIVPIAVGAVFQSSHSFLMAFITLAAGPLLAVLSLLPVREIKRF
ncbi:MAG: MFS transporter [Janthinobacterium lividum]